MCVLLIVVAIVSLVLGNLLNALFLHWVLGWSWPQLREVFLYSQVPAHWLKIGSTQPAVKKSFGLTGYLVAYVFVAIGLYYLFKCHGMQKQ